LVLDMLKRRAYLPQAAEARTFWLHDPHPIPPRP
jgi:hypothetical protein